MPFTGNLPAENTDPWYTPLATVWDQLKTFVNGLETAISGKESTLSAGAHVTIDRTDPAHPVISAAASPVSSVNTKTGDVVLTKGDVNLGNVNNTSDTDKPISTAQQAALDAKVTGQNGATGLWIGTQAAYDAIVTKDPAVAYVIKA